MKGMGLPELIIVFFLLLIIFFLYFGIKMVADAARRPRDRFKVGNKIFWIVFFLSTNPFVTKFLGGIFYLAGTVLFMAGVILYYFANIKNNPADMIPDESAQL